MADGCDRLGWRIHLQDGLSTQVSGPLAETAGKLGSAGIVYQSAYTWPLQHGSTRGLSNRGNDAMRK